MVPAAVTWQPPWAQAKLPLGTLLAGVGWHFAQLLDPPWMVWSSSDAWQSEHACVPYGVPSMEMTAAVTVDAWLAWVDGAPAGWQLLVAHTSVGVLPGPWQMSQPLSVRFGTTEWMAATLVPPVWQPEPIQLGATSNVCDAAIEPCCAFMVPAAVTWQPPCEHAKLPASAVFAGVG